MDRQLGLLDGPEFSEQQLEKLLKPLYPPLWLMIRDPFEDSQSQERRTPLSGY